MNGTIGCLGLAAIAGFIGYLFYRRKKISDDLQDFYKQGAYIRREQPPLEYPFVDRCLAFVNSSDGFLKEGMPYTLMLGTKFSGAGKTSRQEDYIGFYIRAHPQLTDEWLNGWKQKVVERGDGWAKHSGMQQVEKSWGLMGAPNKLPIRAARMSEGILLAWIGLHLRKQIEERINDVLASLQKQPPL
jgi:hypothetical protein